LRITYRKEKQSILESKILIETEYKEEKKKWEDYKLQMSSENAVLITKVEKLMNTHKKEKEELDKDYTHRINELKDKNQALTNQLENPTNLSENDKRLLEEIERLKSDNKIESELYNKTKIELSTALNNNVNLENEIRNKYYI
jgi:hypothetical protein